MFIVNFRTVFESKSSNRDKAKLAAEDHHRQQLEQWLEPITE
jgi:hypothetical protein